MIVKKIRNYYQALLKVVLWGRGALAGGQYPQQTIGAAK